MQFYKISNLKFLFIMITHIILLGSALIIAYIGKYPMIVVFTILISFAVLYLLLIKKIERPLALILHAINTDDPSIVKSLSQSKNKFGQIALQYIRASQQHAELISEIHKRNRIEEMLRESEELFRSLIETSPDIILIMDMTANIITGNVQASAFFDISYSVQNINLYTFFHHSELDNYQILIENVIKNSKVKNVECIMLRKDGQSFNAQISLSLLKDCHDKPKNIVAIIKDVSALKNAEIEKTILEEQFRSIYKMVAVGQLAGGIAHDFNNFLGAISGYADIIQYQYAHDEKLSKYSKMILSATTRAAELTRKLLIFLRKSKLRMAAFEIHEVLTDTIELLEHTIDKKIIIKSDFKAEKSVIIGDSSQFQSSMMNLALNSRDAMPDGGTLTITTCNIRIDKKNHPLSVEPGFYVRIIVSDTGAGIDKQIFSHLFEPFFTTKGIGKGTGLGLASVYKTVKSNQGYIDVESEQGKGTAFTMYFPVTQQTIEINIKPADVQSLLNRTNETQ